MSHPVPNNSKWLNDLKVSFYTLKLLAIKGLHITIHTSLLKNSILLFLSPHFCFYLDMCNTHKCEALSVCFSQVWDQQKIPRDGQVSLRYTVRLLQIYISHLLNMIGSHSPQVLWLLSFLYPIPD